MHIGSGTDMEHLSQVCAAMEKTALAVGSSITSISAGGGLPTPYREGDECVDVAGYFELWDATRGRLAKEFGHHVSLEIEPGRYLAAESGYLVAEIRAVKQMGGNTYYLLDAGFNNLARPILYGAYHPMAVCPADGATSRPHAATWWWADPCASRATSSRRKTAASSAAARCPKPRSATFSSSAAPARTATSWPATTTRNH